jgi:hypothetical protein
MKRILIVNALFSSVILLCTTRKSESNSEQEIRKLMTGLDDCCDEKG